MTPIDSDLLKACRFCSNKPREYTGASLTISLLSVGRDQDRTASAIYRIQRRVPR